MASITASDVTYTLDQNDASYPLGKHGKVLYATIAFGDGSLTVPDGGIPLEKKNLGCPYRLRSLEVIESNASGYVFEYDVSAEKLLMLYQDGDAGNLVSVEASPDSVAPAAVTLQVRVVGY
jgi:hypothetical protein